MSLLPNQNLEKKSHKSEYCDNLNKINITDNLSEISTKENNYNLIKFEGLIEKEPTIMKDEIFAAVTFLIRLITGNNNQLTKQQTDCLQERITELLTQKFNNHWHPDKPSKGQAFRCIRVNSLDRSDSVLESACQTIGISYNNLKMPVELTLWIDPEEVTCRFGEHKGSYCLLAKFKGGNKENFVNQINITELEQKSIERQRQASIDLMNSRKKKYNKNGFKNNTVLTPMHINNNTNSFDIVNTNSGSNYYHYYASSPKYYSTSPPQMQQHNNQQTNSGLYSPNRMSPYRNNSNLNNTFANLSNINNKFVVRNLQNSFSNTGSNTINGTLPFESFGNNDRYHWMNKSVVKA